MAVYTGSSGLEVFNYPESPKVLHSQAISTPTHPMSGPMHLNSSHGMLPFPVGNFRSQLSGNNLSRTEVASRDTPSYESSWNGQAIPRLKVSHLQP